MGREPHGAGRCGVRGWLEPSVACRERRNGRLSALGSSPSGEFPLMGLAGENAGGLMRVLRVALVSVGALALLLVVSAAALLAVLDDDDYRQIAVRLVERATGRAVAIDGQFSFHVGPEPSLTASDVRVANAPWASRPDLVHIRHLEVQLALAPLLSGKLLIPRLILENADFDLEKSADGRTNWVTPLARGGLVPRPRHRRASQRRLALSRSGDRRGDCDRSRASHPRKRRQRRPPRRRGNVGRSRIVPKASSGRSPRRSIRPHLFR